MNALEVAKAVINKGLEHDSPLTHLQLQKILLNKSLVDSQLLSTSYWAWLTRLRLAS